MLVQYELPILSGLLFPFGLTILLREFFVALVVKPCPEQSIACRTVLLLFWTAFPPCECFALYFIKTPFHSRLCSALGSRVYT